MSEEEEETRVCSVCNKEVQKILHCSRCEEPDYLLCSKSCQVTDWNRHKKVQCRSSPTDDVGTILHNDDVTQTYKASVERGYKWHVEDKGVENAMSWRKWVKAAFPISLNFDEKIAHHHGVVQWKNGDRTPNGLFNTQFKNLCDALIMMNLAENGGLSFVSNMPDGLSVSQMIFVKDNFDFFWLGYHDTNSYIPVDLSPPPGRSREVFDSEAFQKKQAEKTDKYLRRNLFEDYIYFMARQNRGRR